MTTLGWLAIVLWSMAAIQGMRIVLATWLDGDEVTAGEFLFALFLSAYFGAIGGPFIVAYDWFRRATTERSLTRVAYAIAAEPHDAKVKRLEGEAKARERRIRELERDLDMA